MSIKKAIRVKLESVAEAAALSMPFYQPKAPQRQAFPYGVFKRVGTGDFNYNIQQRLSDAREVFEIDIYHDDDEALETVRNGIIKAVHAQGPVTWSDIDIKVALITGSTDLSELENEAGETVVCRHQLTLVVKYIMP